MLLYSTRISVKDTLSKEEFINLVIEWNQKSRFDKMNNIVWDGRTYNCRFQEENRSLAIEELRTNNIIAARFRKEDDNKVVWTTDFILNMSRKILVVRLDRETTDETICFVPKFAPPRLVKMIVHNGYAGDDNGLPISDTPVAIHDRNYILIEDVILRNKKYLLPIVYVTKTWAGNYPLDVDKLAQKLQGVAHVLKETNHEVSKILMKQCCAQNVHHGGIGIYYPSKSASSRKIYTEKYIGMEDVLIKRIVDYIIRYSNQQRYENMSTWEGVQNEILRLKNESLQEKRKKVENENQDLIDIFGEQLDEQESTIRELNNRIASLTQENQGLRAKLDGLGEVPLIYRGDEEDLYEGEVKEIVMDILNEGLKNQKPNSRRVHVIKDLLETNEFSYIPDERKDRIKHILKGYSTMHNIMRKELQEFGFDISADGKHYKLTYYNDNRYTVTMAKSCSDGRAGNNLASEISKSLL